MSLNIKNERVHELAREAAAKSGQSQTSVVETALRHYLDELDREATHEARMKRVYEILADVHARIEADPERYDFSTDFLYDENGLPA
jgi:antitoxin VapB